MEISKECYGLLLWGYSFQKDLVVWKSMSLESNFSICFTFQKDLVVWKFM